MRKDKTYGTSAEALVLSDVYKTNFYKNLENVKPENRKFTP